MLFERILIAIGIFAICCMLTAAITMFIGKGGE